MCFAHAASCVLLSCQTRTQQHTCSYTSHATRRSNVHNSEPRAVSRKSSIWQQERPQIHVLRVLQRRKCGSERKKGGGCQHGLTNVATLTCDHACYGNSAPVGEISENSRKKKIEKKNEWWLLCERPFSQNVASTIVSMEQRRGRENAAAQRTFVSHSTSSTPPAFRCDDDVLLFFATSTEERSTAERLDTRSSCCG
jgi:hypothetical protein